VLGADSVSVSRERRESLGEEQFNTVLVCVAKPCSYAAIFGLETQLPISSL